MIRDPVTNKGIQDPVTRLTSVTDLEYCFIVALWVLHAFSAVRKILLRIRLAERRVEKQKGTKFLCKVPHKAKVFCSAIYGYVE